MNISEGSFVISSWRRSKKESCPTISGGSGKSFRISAITMQKITLIFQHNSLPAIVVFLAVIRDGEIFS
jgi:hypothetical protein